MGKFGFSFSAKRAVGITKARAAVARATGIPTTKAARKRKATSMLLAAMFPSRSAHQTAPPAATPGAVEPPRATDGGLAGAVKRLIGFAVLLGSLITAIAAFALYSDASRSSAWPYAAAVAALLALWGLSWAKRPAPSK